MDNKADKLRIVFVGTPEFSVPGLESLVEDGRFEVVGVVCGQDKKVGRKQIVSEPAVKEFAKGHNLCVFQPERISDVFSELEQLSIDMIVVIAYGQIIPKKILELPKYGCINVHGSLLPKYRGSSCVQAAIQNLDKRTGITIMRMDEKLDTGPIIYQESIEIDNSDTSDSLSQKLALLSKKTLASSLIKYVNGDLVEKKQDDNQATIVKNIKKDDGRINWNQSPERVSAFVRSMISWPGAYSEINGQPIKIIELGEAKKSESKTPGKIVNDMSKLFVQCNGGQIEIKQIQMAGKKVISGKDFLQGYARLVGQILQ